MTAPTLARPTDTGACGTPAGRQRHRRKGELACEPCRTARLDQQRAHYTARAAARRSRPLVTAEDRRAAKLALPLRSGQLACTNAPHPFGGAGTVCRHCWGFRDDPRHPVVGGPAVGR